MIEKITNAVDREINSTVGRVDLFGVIVSVTWIAATGIDIELTMDGIFLSRGSTQFGELVAVVFLVWISVHYTAKFAK